VSTPTTTPSPPVLAARDIRTSYGKGAARFDALAGVSLSVCSGESIAIVGKSGSGKSTLMHLLASLDQPHEVESVVWTHAAFVRPWIGRTVQVARSFLTVRTTLPIF